LDPGLAFGTGTHPTTALCLEWLDQNIKGGEDILDYGCGSGILGIAAVKLGATSALGVDYDPQALEAGRLNAELNALTPAQFDVVLPVDFLPHEKEFDIIVANILAKPLMELGGEFASYLKQKGEIILSGILTSQVSEVVGCYENYFQLVSAANKEEWARLHFIKR